MIQNQSRKNQKWFVAIFILELFIVLLVTVIIPHFSGQGNDLEARNKQTEEELDNQVKMFRHDIESEDPDELGKIIREENDQNRCLNSDPSRIISNQVSRFGKQKIKPTEKQEAQKSNKDLARKKLDQKLLGNEPGLKQNKNQTQKNKEAKRKPKNVIKDPEPVKKNKMSKRKVRSKNKYQGSKLSDRELRIKKRKKMQDSNLSRKSSSIKNAPLRKIPRGSFVLGRLMLRLTEKISKKEIQVKAHAT